MIITRFFTHVCSPLTTPFRRSKAVHVLAEHVQIFDTSNHPEGCIDVVQKIRLGWGLIRTYSLNGPEFGVGSVERYYAMGEHALRRAIDIHRPKKSGFVEDLLKQLDELHAFRNVMFPPEPAPQMDFGDAITA